MKGDQSEPPPEKYAFKKPSCIRVKLALNFVSFFFVNGVLTLNLIYSFLDCGYIDVLLLLHFRWGKILSYSYVYISEL